MFIINRFVIFRLKISGKKNSQLLNKYSSKSINAHGETSDLFHILLLLLIIIIIYI